MLFDIENQNSGYRIDHDDRMGRVLVSCRDINVGEIIFYERAFVYATEDDDDIENEFESIVNSAFSKPVLKNLSNIIDDLTQFDRIQSLDTAKNFILLLAIFITRKKDPTGQLLLQKCSQWNVNLRDIVQKINMFDQLTAHKLNECIDDATQIQSQFPHLIPFKLLNITVEEIGKLIGILNTNQLEMGASGSGLFVGTAILQHDCCPNTSFNIHDNTLYLVAVRNILNGENMSIDYGNNFYHSTENRINELHSTYGFYCQCSLCLGPDTKRGFKCNQCSHGIVYPISQGNTYETKFNLTCNQCHTVIHENYLNQCYAREQFYQNFNEQLEQLSQTTKNTKKKINNNVMNLNEISILNIIENEILLHETHHLLFWALDEFSLKMTENAQKEMFVGKQSAAIQYYRYAQTALSQAVKLLEFQLPKVHSEKVIYYDRLAQLAIAVQDISSAKELYRIAYQHSCMANGNTTPTTLSIRELVDNTPSSLTELANRYYK